MATLCCWPFVVGWNILMSYLLNNPHNTLRIFSLLQKELQNLEDAGDELMMLDDDTTPIPYRIGEIFIHLSSEETQEYLENAKSKIQDEIKSLESNTAEVKQLLADLKVKLYAKFGNNINLEAEEE